MFTWLNKDKDKDKEIKAIRIEIPKDLYVRFRKQLDNDYTSTTSFIKEQIVTYVREGEKGKGD